MPENDRDYFRETLSFIPESVHEKLDYHREFVGEQVYRTTVFWSEVFVGMLSAWVYSWSESFLTVLGVILLTHLFDFCLWMLEKVVFQNFDPVEWAFRRVRS